MTCDRVRDLLPLAVEGDLSASDAAPLSRHLAGCPACREEERLFRDSQAFWKEAPAPIFDEPFHADVRRAVRVQIGAEEEARRSRWGRIRAWGLLAGSAAVLAIVLLSLGRPRRVPRTMEALAPTAAPLVPAPLVVAPAPVASPPPLVAARHTVQPRSPRRREPAPAFARVTRIEITTPNPNVRIIWLANASEAAPI